MSQTDLGIATARCTPGHGHQCMTAICRECKCACGGANHGKQKLLFKFKKSPPDDMLQCPSCRHSFVRANLGIAHPTTGGAEYEVCPSCGREWYHPGVEDLAFGRIHEAVIPLRYSPETEAYVRIPWEEVEHV